MCPCDIRPDHSDITARGKLRGGDGGVKNALQTCLFHVGNKPTFGRPYVFAF